MGGANQILVAQRHGVRPKRVITTFQKVVESPDRIAYCGPPAGIGGIREYPHRAVLGEGTRCPPAFAVLAEPLVGSLMVGVNGIEERHQDVHVQEGGQQSLLLVSQPIHQLHTHRTLAWTPWEQRDSVADFGWRGI